MLWEDFHQKLVDGSLLTLDTYLGQFPDIKVFYSVSIKKRVEWGHVVIETWARKKLLKVLKLTSKILGNFSFI